MNPSGWYRLHVVNRDTLYLGDQNCLTRKSVVFYFCSSFHLRVHVSACQLLINIKWSSYVFVKLGQGLELNINCCFKLFRNTHENWGWGREKGIRVYFELNFSAITNTGVGSFQFQTTVGNQLGVRTQIMGYSNLGLVWLL